MFKKLTKNEGSTSLTMVILIPVMLLIIFMMIDFASFAVQKQNLQRKLDAATIGVAAQARPADGSYISEDGYIIDEATGLETEHIACEVTETMLNQAYDRVSQSTSRDIDLYEIKYVSSQAEKEDGVVRISARGEYNDMMTRIFRQNIKIPFVVQSYAVCSYSVR